MAKKLVVSEWQQEHRLYLYSLFASGSLVLGAKDSLARQLLTSLLDDRQFGIYIQTFPEVEILASVTRPLVSELSFEDALEALSHEERFMGTVSAMNSLLMKKKGIYSTTEFQEIFVEWAAAQMEKPSSRAPVNASFPISLGPSRSATCTRILRSGTQVVQTDVAHLAQEAACRSWSNGAFFGRCWSFLRGPSRSFSSISLLCNHDRPSLTV
jgi:hypothetical protein